jgi:tetratricopeptide (TPR) repeat protein
MLGGPTSLSINYERERLNVMRKAPNRIQFNTSPPGAALEVCLSGPPHTAGADGPPQGSPQTPQTLPVQSPSQYKPLPTRTCPPNAGSASAINRTQIEKHRLIILGLSSIQSEVIAHLSRQAEIAYTLRQLDKLEAVCRQLEQVSPPIASFYRGYLEQYSKQRDLSAARSHLEYALSEAPLHYQARAALVLGNVANHQRDYKTESECYRFALSVNRNDRFAVVEAYRALSIQASAAGEHAEAIHLLQNVIPPAVSNPYLQAQVLNSLAVEYHHAGRLQEAARLAEIVCASPLAAIYHEFGETRKGIQEDLREQEARPLIIASAAVAVETVCAITAKEEKKQQSGPGRAVRIIYARPGRESINPACAPVVIFDHASSFIQSRAYSCAPIHAPPSSFRK